MAAGGVAEIVGFPSNGTIRCRKSHDFRYLVSIGSRFLAVTEHDGSRSLFFNLRKSMDGASQRSTNSCFRDFVRLFDL